MESVRVQKRSGSVLFMFLKLGTSFRKANDNLNDAESAFRRGDEPKMGCDRRTSNCHFGRHLRGLNDVPKSDGILRGFKAIGRHIVIK
jgi:hypothetical protein